MNDHTSEPLPQEETQQKKKKKRPHSFFRTLRLILHILAALVTLVLVVGTVLLVAYRDKFNLETLKYYLTYSQLSSNSDEMVSFVHAGGDQMDFCRLDSGAVLASQTGGHYYSLSGQSYAEAIGTLSVPILTHSNNTAVIYDGGGQSLYLFADYEMPFSLTLNSGEELLSARPNEKGWLAVTAQLSGYKGSVSIYDSSHQLTMEINLSSSFLMDAALSPNSKTVAVVTIGQTAGVFQSTLHLYPVGDETPSASIDLGDTVVLDMDYEDDHIWILGDQSLLVINLDDNSLQSYSYEQYHIKGYTLDGEGFAALLFSEYESGDPNRLVTIGENGQLLGFQSLMGEVPDIDGAGDYVSILSSSGLTVYTSTLTQYAQLDDSQGAQVLAQSSDGSVLLAGAQKAWVYVPNL